MKKPKYFSYLILLIIVLSVFSSLMGLLSQGGIGEYEIESFHKELIRIYGIGLYKNDSVSIASQGIASDFVTLILGVPLLGVSLYFSNKGSFKGNILLTGTLGYFLYTYTSYTFLWMYNPLFIVYVMLMSLSLFTFILSMMTYNVDTITSQFDKRLPVKFIGGFQIFIAVAIGMLWLSKIAPTIFEGKMPVELEHYTTLVIQGMDLGIVVPAAIISGVLLIKRSPYGYLLSSVIIIKAITMLFSISAMIINQALHDVNMGLGDVLMFPFFNLIAIICLFLLLKNTKDKIVTI